MSPGAAPTKVLYQSIVSGAPAPTDLCTFSFSSVAIPGPYPATVPAPTGPCGSQRPGFNSAPAIGPGGTIFVVSRAHHSLPPQAGESLKGRSANDSSIVALNSDLTPKWTFTMREILDDGCGVLAACRQGAPTGVDPSTGLKPSVWVWDQASSVPVALPDGAVIYGGLTSYNGSRGHLMKVGPDGGLMGTYDFGWDVTPAVWVRDGRSGYLLVGGLLDNVIYKIAADKTVSVFMEKAGYTGTDVDHVGAQTRSGRSHVLLIGPSCASLDSQGRLIWCADNDRTVMRLEKDGAHTVLSAGAPDGKRFSGPNDVAVTRDDAVYLTDNDFGLRDAGRSPDKQMPNGIWRIKDGKSTLVLDAATLGGIPNGIALSPDEHWLYATALAHAG